MTNPLEMRALFALYRNHPSTAPGDRWGVSAHRRAMAQREMLLAWAATLPDERLLDCRNLGVRALAWIRSHQDDAPHRLRCIDCGQEIGPGMVPCPTPGRSQSVREAAAKAGIPIREKRDLPMDIVRPPAFAEDWDDPAMDVYDAPDPRSPFADLEAENAQLAARLAAHHRDTNITTCEVCGGA